MDNQQHVEVTSLSPHVRKALDSVSYGARDIPLIAAESVDSYSEGDRGSRGFVLILNLDTGAYKRVTGQWGGGNMFTRSPVDEGGERIPIPPNGAVIKGSMGYPRTFARIYAHPEAHGRFLPSGETETLSPEEAQCVYCFCAIKGGEYRRDEMRRRGVTPATVDSLVERGYLKRSKNGATAITTKGKNARTVRN